MQTKQPILSSPKVIKNYFLLYYSKTPKHTLQAIYQKALTLIESFIIDSCEDIASLQQIKELTHALGVRIEIGVNSDIKWLPELQALTTNRCVLL